MNSSSYFLFMMFFASLFAFLKLFYKTTNYTYFIVIGIVFSILEFIFRIPSIDIGVKALGYSVIWMQIIWISMNFITSSLLGNIMYGELLNVEKVMGMMLILGGVYVAGNGNGKK